MSTYFLPVTDSYAESDWGSIHFLLSSSEMNITLIIIRKIKT